MAGKFVSIEEAARLLGVSTDEVNRLVDRKKLFPMRDGAALKFKVDEIERVAAALGDDSSRSESMSLDLELPGSGVDDLAIGDAIDVADLALASGVDAGPQTAVGGPAAGGSAAELSGLALGDDDEASESGDLALESIVGASSPSLPRPSSASGSLVGPASGADDALTIDLSNIVAGGSVALPGSQVTGSLSGKAAAPGSGSFAAPLDSGLSLEDGGVAVSGIDLDVGPASVVGVSDVGAGLGGDAFELGADTGDEESASVVIATEETGDSSFFANAAEDSASIGLGDSSAMDSASSSLLGDAIPEPIAEMGFSPWQIAGLVCCALVLLLGGFIMYDLAWTIRTPRGTPVSAPLLNALSAVFGWRS